MSVTHPFWVMVNTRQPFLTTKSNKTVITPPLYMTVQCRQQWEKVKPVNHKCRCDKTAIYHTDSVRQYTFMYFELRLHLECGIGEKVMDECSLCQYTHVSWHLPPYILYIWVLLCLFGHVCACVCVCVCKYPVFSQCVVAGGLLYEGPVVLQTGLAWRALLPRLRLLHCSHLMQAGEGLTVLPLETHKHIYPHVNSIHSQTFHGVHGNIFEMEIRMFHNLYLPILKKNW